MDFSDYIHLFKGKAEGKGLISAQECHEKRKNVSITAVGRIVCFSTLATNSNQWQIFSYLRMSSPFKPRRRGGIEQIYGFKTHLKEKSNHDTVL